LAVTSPMWYILLIGSASEFDLREGYVARSDLWWHTTIGILTEVGINTASIERSW
jgi:hypothetical protein